MPNKFGPQTESEKRIFAQENARVDFQYNLQELINRAKISRKDLAKKVRMTEKQINELFSSEADPSIKTIAAIFNALGVELVISWKS